VKLGVVLGLIKVNAVTVVRRGLVIFERVMAHRELAALGAVVPIEPAAAG